MNFKIFLLITSIALCGCGVRGKPLTPPETAIPSYLESYTGTTPLPAEDKKSPTAPSPEKK